VIPLGYAMNLSAATIAGNTSALLGGIQRYFKAYDTNRYYFFTGYVNFEHITHYGLTYTLSGDAIDPFIIEIFNADGTVFYGYYAALPTTATAIYTQNSIGVPDEQIMLIEVSGYPNTAAAYMEKFIFHMYEA